MRMGSVSESWEHCAASLIRVAPRRTHMKRYELLGETRREKTGGME
jgi:hypothetical protein